MKGKQLRIRKLDLKLGDELPGQTCFGFGCSCTPVVTASEGAPVEGRLRPVSELVERYFWRYSYEKKTAQQEEE